MTIDTTAPPPPRPRGRPRSPDVEQRVVDAARALFARDGYDGVSMDSVATAAGVSKQTLYRRFGDKERLFAAVVTRARETAGAARAAAALDGPSPEPARDLARFGARLLEVVLDPEVAALQRLVIAEMARHPDLAAAWGDGPAVETKQALRRYLARAADAGLLSVPDDDLATDQFVTLLIATGRRDSRHGLVALSPAARRRLARQATDLLLRALRPETS